MAAGSCPHFSPRRPVSRAECVCSEPQCCFGSLRNVRACSFPECEHLFHRLAAGAHRECCLAVPLTQSGYSQLLSKSKPRCPGICSSDRVSFAFSGSKCQHMQPGSALVTDLQHWKVSLVCLKQTVSLSRCKCQLESLAWWLLLSLICGTLRPWSSQCDRGVLHQRHRGTAQKCEFSAAPRPAE